MLRSPIYTTFYIFLSSADTPRLGGLLNDVTVTLILMGSELALFRLWFLH